MRKLSGHTVPFAVLGHPIGHTLSPVMHNAAIEAMDFDGIYLAFDVEPSRLMEALSSMAAMGFQGVNLTVPLKEVAFNGLDDLDDSARHLGAVNTVQVLPSGLRGHNTDGFGFLAAVEEAFGSGIEEQSVFVLGTGGAGRAVAITCAVRGAGQVAVTDLEAGRAEKVAAEIGGLAPDCTVDVVGADTAAWIAAARSADLVVQATPVGMKPEDEPLLKAEAFREGQWLLDLVYMYPDTGIMKEAAQAGARTANGLGMLLHQGAEALRIWTGKDVPVAIMRKALENEVYGK